MSEPIPYGFVDNLCAAFNVTPAQAERAILEAQAAAGGPLGFRWLALELRRLTVYTGGDAPSSGEVAMLLELARRANDRGIVTVSRREIAELNGWTEREVGHAIEWGAWRHSFTVRGLSTAGAGRRDRYALRGWPADGTAQDGSALGNAERPAP